MSEAPPRKRITSESPGWMVTYADMMSLLLCLFIMLLSFAKVDSNTFQKNAGPINEAFGISKTTPDMIAPPTPNIITLNPFKTDPRTSEENRVILELKQKLAKEIMASMIDLEVKDNLVIIRFPGSAAFPSGTADLSSEFLPTLAKIAEVLKGSKGRVIISGHTDDIPISTERYRSNWDLSAARSVSVAHYMLNNEGINPKRITVQGLADSLPLVPNNSPENRARNRRVEVALEVPTDKAR